MSKNVGQLLFLVVTNITDQKTSKKAGGNAGRLNTGWISTEVETASILATVNCRIQDLIKTQAVKRPYLKTCSAS